MEHECEASWKGTTGHDDLMTHTARLTSSSAATAAANARGLRCKE